MRTISASSLRLQLGLCGLIATAACLGGPAAQAADSREQENIRLVLDFQRQVFEAQDVAAAQRYLAPGYLQHNPNVPTGRDGFVRYMSSRWRARQPEPQLRIPPDLIFAEGDVVQMVFRRPQADPKRPGEAYDSWWFDTYRVRDHMIVEHWDPAVKAAPPVPTQPAPAQVRP